MEWAITLAVVILIVAILTVRQVTKLERQHRATMKRQAAMAQREFERAVEEMGK